MSASDLRARLLLIQGVVQECLEMLGGVDAVKATTSDSGIVVPKGSRACAHPESLKTRMMGGYWMCDPLKGGCGEKGRDTDMKGAP